MTTMVLPANAASAALLSGQAKASEATRQAEIADFNADQARLASEEKALRIRREAVQKVGAARVAFAGSGLDISSSAAMEDAYRNEAGFEQYLARTSGTIDAAGKTLTANAYRSRATASLVEGDAMAKSKIADGLISIARRG